MGVLVQDGPDRRAVSIRQAVAGAQVTDPELGVSAFGARAYPRPERERAVRRAARGGSSIAEITAPLILAEGMVRNYLAEAIQTRAARNRGDGAQLAEEQGGL